MRTRLIDKKNICNQPITNDNNNIILKCFYDVLDEDNILQLPLIIGLKAIIGCTRYITVGPLSLICLMILYRDIEISRTTMY